jgi:hypothetical protein
VLAHREFCKLAEWMAKAFKNRILLSHSSMLSQDYLDYVNAPMGHVDALLVEDLDMYTLFNFDDQAADEKVKSSGQHGERGDFSNDHINAEPKSNSELSEVSSIPALNPGHPANEYLGSRAIPKATHQTKDQDQLSQARGSPSVHVQSQEPGFNDNFSIRQASRKQRTINGWRVSNEINR